MQKNLEIFLKSQFDCNEEIASAIINCLPRKHVDEFVTSWLENVNIRDPNLPELLCMQSVQWSIFGGPTQDLERLASALLAIAVHFSQYVGENCFTDLAHIGLLNPWMSRILLDPFPGSVDCRGHPIMADDLHATEISVKAWTCSKAAILALKSLITHIDFHQDVATDIVVILTTLLLSVKHPAEISPIEDTFLAVSRKYPGIVEERVLEPVLTAVTGGGIFRLPMALRRSQGLGPLIGAICKSRANVVFLGSVINRLLVVISHANDENENALHSINILRAIVRDSDIPDRFIEPHVAHVMSESIDILHRLSSDFWRIRSSATQLFVQSARRYIGADNEDDWTANGGMGKSRSRKIVSASEFFYNRGAQNILTKFIKAIQVDESIVVSVLSVLQSLSHFGQFATESPDGHVLMSVVREKLVASKSAHVRKLCSKIIARSMIETGKCDFDNMKVGTMNSLHGILSLESYLLRMGMKFDSASRIDHLTGCDIVDNLIIECTCRRAGSTDLPEWLLSKSAREFVLLYLCTIDEEDVKSIPGISKLVLAHCTDEDDNIAHPIYSSLIVAASSRWTDEIMCRLIPVWIRHEFWLGLGACIYAGNLTSDLEILISKFDVTNELVFDEVKISLAKSESVRCKFPEIHATLLTDESPVVRLAACVRGLNCVESLLPVLQICGDKFLTQLSDEVIGSIGDEYRLKHHATQMAREILHARS
jgi:hypothetical protein